MTRLADIHADGDERGHYTPEEEAEIEELILHGDPTAPEPRGLRAAKPTKAETRSAALAGAGQVGLDAAWIRGGRALPHYGRFSA